MNPTIELLKSHRSIRKYEDRNIEEEKINTIIEAAQWSATSGHFQAYSIIQVKDPDKRRIISEVAGGQKWVVECPLFLVFCANLKRSKNYWEEIDPNVLGNMEMLLVATIDASLAAQKAFIAAQSLGLGGVFIGGIRNDIKAVSDLLELPELVSPLFGMCLGYPAEKHLQKPRLPKSLVYKENQYSEDGDDLLMAEYNDLIRQYYFERTKEEKKVNWSKQCGRAMMAKTRDQVGGFLKSKGFGLR